MQRRPQHYVCAQQRLRSSDEPAHSVQCIRCLHEETLGPWIPLEREEKKKEYPKLLSRLILVFARSIQ